MFLLLIYLSCNIKVIIIFVVLVGIHIWLVSKILNGWISWRKRRSTTWQKWKHCLANPDHYLTALWNVLIMKDLQENCLTFWKPPRLLWDINDLCSSSRICNNYARAWWKLLLVSNSFTVLVGLHIFYRVNLHGKLSLSWVFKYMTAKSRSVLWVIAWRRLMWNKAIKDSI